MKKLIVLVLGLMYFDSLLSAEIIELKDSNSTYQIDKETYHQINISHPKLMEMLMSSRSLDQNQKERRYWLSVLAVMTQPNIDELDNILKDEKDKLKAIEKTKAIPKVNISSQRDTQRHTTLNTYMLGFKDNNYTYWIGNNTYDKINASHHGLIEMMLSSLSMSQKEKSNALSPIAVMSQPKLDRLMELLIKEKLLLEDIEKKYVITPTDISLRLNTNGHTSSINNLIVTEDRSGFIV